MIIEVFEFVECIKGCILIVGVIGDFEFLFVLFVDEVVLLFFVDEKFVVQICFVIMVFVLFCVFFGENLDVVIVDVEVVLVEFGDEELCDVDQYIFFGCGWMIGFVYEVVFKLCELLQLWIEVYFLMDYCYGLIVIVVFGWVIWQFGEVLEGFLVQVEVIGVWFEQCVIDLFVDFVCLYCMVFDCVVVWGFDFDQLCNFM